MGRRKKVVPIEESLSSTVQVPAADSLLEGYVEEEFEQSDGEKLVPVNVAKLWSAIAAEVESFLASCDNTWEVEWPHASGRASSPTGKIYVNAPKPWVKDDFQTCAEVVVHIDLRQSPPVQVKTYITQMILKDPNTIAHYSYILQDACDLVKALSKIDVDDFRVPASPEDNILLNYPKTNEEISGADEETYPGPSSEEETTQVSEQYVPYIDVADDFN